MQAAIKSGHHKYVLAPDAITQLHVEVKANVNCGQAHIVDWNAIKHDPLPVSKLHDTAQVADLPYKSGPVIHNPSPRWFLDSISEQIIYQNNT